MRKSDLPNPSNGSTNLDEIGRFGLLPAEHRGNLACLHRRRFVVVPFRILDSMLFILDNYDSFTTTLFSGSARSIRGLMSG